MKTETNHIENMKSEHEIQQALLCLKRQHAKKQDWLKWYAKLEQVASFVGCGPEDDISDLVFAQHFVSAGFTEAEADAFTFVMTQDCMGRACTSVEMIDRWFCYEI